MTLITSKIKTKNTFNNNSTSGTSYQSNGNPRPRKSLHKEQPPGKASQPISHIERTCQQGTAVQDTRSTETSITVPR